jgi:hypothetical protein
MNISATKIELLKDLLETNSEVVLKHIKAVLKSYKTDLWDDLTENQKQSVKRAKKQLEKGEGKPHADVMKKYEKWISK